MAQTPWYFNFKTDSLKNAEMIRKVGEASNYLLSAYSKSDQILAKELYETRRKEVLDQFKQKAVITDTELHEYLMKIVNVLKISNPSLLSHQMQIFFSRSFIPNAVSYGDGTILFHIGLFRQLHNEAEAAFILGHEIGHYVLGHSDKKIRNYIAKVNSDSVQQLLTKLKKQEFNSGHELDQLERETMLGLSHHSREFEKQADSFAVVLLLNSGYDVHAAETCLTMLDSV
ncbi:MAG: M48 family metalloprotease, partial [Chitinophagaceae bacterium]